jgi:hypothetical protein
MGSILGWFEIYSRAFARHWLEASKSARRRRYGLCPLLMLHRLLLFLTFGAAGKVEIIVSWFEVTS